MYIYCFQTISSDKPNLFIYLFTDIYLLYDLKCIQQIKNYFWSKNILNFIEARSQISIHVYFKPKMDYALPQGAQFRYGGDLTTEQFSVIYAYFSGKTASQLPLVTCKSDEEEKI